ncbi:22825_t:CDS:2, partial [Gigaspora rosea]
EQQSENSLLVHRLEKLLIDDAENRKVKEDLCSSDMNTLALQPRSGRILPDNRYKQWIWFAHKDMGVGTLVGLLNIWRSVATGISKKKNRWITNFPTTLLKDNSKSFPTPTQECLLLQLEEIDSVEWELVKAQRFTEKVTNLILENLEKNLLEAQAVSLAWALLKDETRAIITLRDLCTIVFKETQQERIAARQDYVRDLVKQKTINSLWALLTSSKETLKLSELLYICTKKASIGKKKRGAEERRPPLKRLSGARKKEKKVAQPKRTQES